MNFRFIIFIICFAYCTSCNDDVSYNEIESKKIDSIYRNAANHYIDRDSLHKVLDTITTIFFSKKKTNFWEKRNYYQLMAHIHGRRFGNFKKSILYLDTILNMIDNGNRKKVTEIEYAGFFIEKAFAHFELGEYNHSIDNYFKAESILSNNINECDKTSIINAIALVLYKQKNYEQALSYYKKEAQLILKCNPDFQNQDPSALQRTFDDIGLCYFNLLQIDSSEKYFKKALEVIEKGKYKFRENKRNSEYIYYTCKGVIFGNLAKIYISKGMYDSAKAMYQQAIFFNTQLGSERNDAQICRLQLAELCYQINDLLMMKSVLTDFKNEKVRTPNIESEINWLRLQTLYHNKLHDDKNELLYYKKYIHKRDSLSQSNHSSKIISITKELENKQQKLRINLLQKNNQLSKLYISLALSILILVAILAFFIFRNYNKEKRNYKILAQLNNEIIEQQKITEKALEQVKTSSHDKDRILNVVAHDLRNPIGAIANFLEIVQLKYKHSDAEEKILSNSQQAAVRSLHLINDLLEVNKMQAGDLILIKQDTNVIELIQNSIDQVKYKTIAKQQKIKFTKSVEKIVISLDEEKVQRVIENLLDNAIKFSYLNAVIQVNIELNENTAQIQIKDNGMGIPEILQEHLFTQSIIAKRKGTNNEPSNGLGLSICKQIVEAHGGKIWLKSEEKKGTIFYVEMPLT